MQRWEYRTEVQTREWDKTDKKAGFFRTLDWSPATADILKLGLEGWELVSVAPASGVAGGWISKTDMAAVADYAGMTTQRQFFFKRPLD